MITTILEFFALGTFGFWALCSVLSIVFIACIENENHWFPTLASVGLAAIYWKGFVALGVTWQGLALGALIYVVAGMIWSVYRWFRYVKENADYIRQTFGNTLSASKLADLKDKVSVINNKSRITGWIAYWPWSFVWNIIGDAVKTAFEWMQNIYQRITDHALGGFTVKSEVKDPTLVESRKSTWK